MLCIANNESYGSIITNVILVVEIMNCLGLKKAIESCGGQSSLASLIGKKQAHISIWLNRDKKVPAEMVLTIEKVSGVPRHELRPDIYPPDEYRMICKDSQLKEAA